MGIEPTLSAWEAEVLPLNYTRSVPEGKTHSPRAGIVHHPRRMRFTDLSCDRSPDGSLHAFASGRSFHPLSLAITAKAFAFSALLFPLYHRSPLRTTLLAVNCQQHNGVSTFRACNRVVRVPPFRRRSNVSVSLPSRETTDLIPFGLSLSIALAQSA